MLSWVYFVDIVTLTKMLSWVYYEGGMGVRGMGVSGTWV
jgi:hypothetical protein